MDRLMMRIALAVCIALVATIFLAGAAGLFCAALYLHLATLMSPAGAAAWTGLAALAAMALALVVGRFALVKPAAQPPSHFAAAAPQLDEAQLTQLLSTLVGGELGKTLHDHPKSAAAVALAAGLAFGISPSLRSVLLGLLGSREG